MRSCKHCGRVFPDEEALIRKEDPSPPGISLPPGEEEYLFCPYCGDDQTEKFNLADAIYITEGDDEASAVIEVEGQKFYMNVNDSGRIECHREEVRI